jgi:hypothetical protein
MTTRKDEQAKTWFRSDRAFCSDGVWYFHTREGVDVGPYRNKFETEVDAEMLKSLLVGVAVDQTRRVIRKFMLDDRTTMDNLKGDAFTDYLVEEGVNAIQGGSA